MTRSVKLLLLAATLITGACGDDFHLSTGNLQIGPNPASPGDLVVASFTLNLLPTQSHTIVVIIDEVEYMRETRSDPPPSPVILELGDAADLIAEYGTGAHEVYVLVNANESDDVTRTQSVPLELTDS